MMRNESEKTASVVVKHNRKSRWKKVTMALASVAVFCTTYALIVPGVAMSQDTYCGIEEHPEHTEECYTFVKTCPYGDEDDTIGEKVLICGYADETAEPSDELSVVSPSAEPELICGMEESTHEHTAECYVTGKALVCTQAEHTHTEECFDAETGEILCSLTPHTHTEECFEQRQELVCTETAHTHDTSCYSYPESTAAPAAEESPAAETPVHEHTAECCHYHTAACFEKQLICEKELHTHTLACYSNPNAVETSAVWEDSMRNVRLTGDWSEDVIAVAKSQLGYTASAENYRVNEDESVSPYTRYGAWYGYPYGDWCAMFCSFSLHYAGVGEESVPYNCACDAWVNALTEKGLYHASEYFGQSGRIEPSDTAYVPQKGDLVFFDASETGYAAHVGLVAEVNAEKNTIRTVEGNNSSSVSEYSYKLTDASILGYGALPENPSPCIHCYDVNGVRACGDDCTCECHHVGGSAPASAEAETADSAERSAVVPELEDKISLSATTPDGVTVTLEAHSAAFPYPAEELTLSVTPIEDSAMLSMVESCADDPESPFERRTVLLDIRVMHGEEELEPALPVSVSFSGVETPNNDAQVFHINEETNTAENMNAATAESGEITMTAGSFSPYAVTYTVDFHNGDVVYSIYGESSVMLSEIFEKIGVKRSAAEVENAVFSDPSLLRVEPQGEDWLLTSLAPFSSDETLTITFADGEVYVIRVTDAQNVYWTEDGIPILTSVGGNIGLIDESANTVTFYSSIRGAINAITANTDSDSFIIVICKDYTLYNSEAVNLPEITATAPQVTFTSSFSDLDGNVTTRVLIDGDDFRFVIRMPVAVFKNIKLKTTINNTCFFANGNKLIMDKNVSTSGTFHIFGGGYNSATSTGDTEIELYSGNFGNVNFSGTSSTGPSNINITIAGSASIDSVRLSHTDGALGNGKNVEFNFDGSDGAQINEFKNNCSVSNGVMINGTVRNMKDISNIQLINNCLAVGAVNFEGEVQVRNSLYLGPGIDGNICENSTLFMGSNANESVNGTTSGYVGAITFSKDLNMATASKLIMRGMHKNRYIKGNLNVTGVGAEIDIFKTGTSICPITIEGAYTGTDKLKLGLHKNPKATSTQDAIYGDVFLKFTTAANAVEKNYEPNNLEVRCVQKIDGNICAYKTEKRHSMFWWDDDTLKPFAGIIAEKAGKWKIFGGGNSLPYVTKAWGTVGSYSGVYGSSEESGLGQMASGSVLGRDQYGNTIAAQSGKGIRASSATITWEGEPQKIFLTISGMVCKGIQPIRRFELYKNNTDNHVTVELNLDNLIDERDIDTNYVSNVEGWRYFTFDATDFVKTNGPGDYTMIVTYYIDKERYPYADVESVWSSYKSLRFRKEDGWMIYGYCKNEAITTYTTVAGTVLDIPFGDDEKIKSVDVSFQFPVKICGSVRFWLSQMGGEGTDGDSLYVKEGSTLKSLGTGGAYPISVGKASDFCGPYDFSFAPAGYVNYVTLAYYNLFDTELLDGKIISGIIKTNKGMDCFGSMLIETQVDPAVYPSSTSTLIKPAKAIVLEKLPELTLGMNPEFDFTVKYISGPDSGYIDATEKTGKVTFAPGDKTNTVKSIDFGELFMYEAGDYVFEITETAGTDPDWTYDSHTAQLTLTVGYVTENGKDVLRVTNAVCTDKNDASNTSANVFTNTCTALPKGLTINNTVRNGGDQEKLFHYVMNILDKDGAPFILPAGTGYTVAADGTVSFDLKHGASLNFPSLPTDCKVTITESAYDGYTVKRQQDSDAEVESDKIEELVITNSVTVNFFNDCLAVDISLLKTDDSGNPLAGAVFGIQKDGTDLKFIKDADGEYTRSDSGDASETTWLAVKADGTLLLKDIEPGIVYTLTEITSPTGYNGLAESAVFTPDSTGITLEDHDSVSVNSSGVLVVVNTVGEALPNTGGIGTKWFTWGGIAVMAAALVIGCRTRRRREGGTA